MSSSPFLVFPWQRPFLPALKEHLHEITGGRPGSALVIVPHNRPWRYMAQLYAADGYTGLLPKVLPLADAVGIWRASGSAAPLHTANTLDRVALLHACVNTLSREDETLAARFARMDMALFLPWGLRLAALLEEMYGQMVEIRDIAHVEDEVAAPAAALLGALGRISHAYESALLEKNWTTPGLDLLNLARGDAPIPPLLQPQDGRPVLVAGFYLLTGGEDHLLRRLWQAGADICLHGDPALAENSRPHWACEELAAWMRRWKARAATALQLDEDEKNHRPEYRFFAGYDCHSQLAALHRDLKRADPTDGTAEKITRPENDGSPIPVESGHSTAIVLTDSSLLMPVLHHLPHKDVNVSMGYPLERSPLNRLLDGLLRLQATRSDEGRYYWRHLLQCLRHPYVNMLRTRDAYGQPLLLRDALRPLERIIREGTRFVDLDEVILECRGQLPEALAQLLEETLEALVRAPAGAATTEDMARVLHGLCSFLRCRGDDLWRHFPLDAEAMYRLMRQTVPVLRENLLARTPFPLTTLHGMTREVLGQERVPFEADPLTGLQVLGMLETRLLHFGRVFIVDATDDRLPGNPAQDPLLPDSLRQVLGLPDSRRRERAAAHTLYRLCAGAQEVSFFWQEGISRSSLFDGKKSRSRFVEQLLWQEELARGAVLAPGEPPLETAVCEVRAAASGEKQLERSADMNDALARLLREPLSATRLDVYLQCPLRFAWQYLCGLRPPKEINEGDDPAAVGTCIHDTLKALYEPYLNKTVRSGDISAETVRARFYEQLEAHGLRKLLPADSCLMLEEAAPMRLMRFLENQPADVTIMALEKELKVPLRLAGRDYAFVGAMDRVDWRDGLFYVLDYKTGGIKKLDGSLWTDLAFFSRAGQLCDTLTPAQEAGGSHLQQLEALFSQLRERLPSLQLPCYLAMAQASGMTPLSDAALVELRDDGREHPLFGGLVDEDLDAALGFCRTALALPLLHMEYSPCFAARPDKHCRWCPYAGLCSV